MGISDIASLPRIKQLLIHHLRFWHRVISHFIDNDNIQRASALAYASLLAIVPLLILMFSAFSYFQILDNVAILVQSFLIENLLPTRQQAVSDHLGNITDKHTAISIIGIFALIFTVTALLNTIESAFNHIWKLATSRTWLAKFFTFCLILIIAPTLIATSIIITSYFAAIPIVQDIVDEASMLSHIPFLLPWIISSIALAALYITLPNTKVRFKDAMVGALIAGALFELSKLGFTLYITTFANFEKIYGALGTLPVFLIWLYLTWVVVLLGAEIVYARQQINEPKTTHKEDAT